MAKTGMSQAKYVKRGYGQVEPNHLSAPRNGQVYAQLPAAKGIDVLENGQFVKYDYVNGVCDFSTDASAGAWMLVYNEVKVYRDRETDADFAMIASNYAARVYSPVGQTSSDVKTVADYSGTATYEGSEDPYSVTIAAYNYGALMPEGTTMVPRVFKISVGDIFTTNMVNADAADLEVGTMLKIGDKGILEVGDATGGDLDPAFVVAKVYTMPDLQPGVKIQRVQ
jgi:hypothetical protein